MGGLRYQDKSSSLHRFQIFDGADVALSVARLRVGRHVLCDFLTIRQTEVHAGVRDE